MFVKTYELTSRPALLLCLFMSRLGDFFFSSSMASTNRSEYLSPKLTSRLHPPHFHAAFAGILLYLLSQLQWVDLPCAHASVIADARPAAVIAWMNADSRVPKSKIVTLSYIDLELYTRKAKYLKQKCCTWYTPQP